MRPARDAPNAAPSQMDAQLRALADPTRRAILGRLNSEQELAAGELAQGFRMSRPAVSRHIRVLLEADLIVVRKVAQSRLYAVNARKIGELRAWFDSYWDAALPRLKNAVETAQQERKS